MKHYIFLDDSGQLHRNYPHGKYFVYGGILLKECDLHGINKSYKNLVKKIKNEKRIEDELKTVHMDLSTRRRLLKKLASYSCEQIFATVDVHKLVRINFNNKKDIVRYKNHIIRRLVEKLIKDGKIQKKCESIEINIDNQNIAHSSIDNLQEHLTNYFNEENYYLIHKQYDTTSFQSEFVVNFKDSKTNYLIQAADLLANTKFNELHYDHNIRKVFKQGSVVMNFP